MDINMPEMNGWETIQAIIEQNLIEGNIVCMLTAVPVPDDEMNKFKEYVIDYMLKPFKYEMLVKTTKILSAYLN